jgi:predicted nucleotidyltransferase
MTVAHGAELTLEDLCERRRELCEVAARRGAGRLRVFGSVARGDAGPSSDVDLLVDLEPERSLLDLGGLLMDLSELLGVEVDVVTEASLNPRVRARVLAEAVVL